MSYYNDLHPCSPAEHINGNNVFSRNLNIELNIDGGYILVPDLLIHDTTRIEGMVPSLYCIGSGWYKGVLMDDGRWRLPLELSPTDDIDENEIVGDYSHGELLYRLLAAHGLVHAPWWSIPNTVRLRYESAYSEMSAIVRTRPARPQEKSK